MARRAGSSDLPLQAGKRLSGWGGLVPVEILEERDVRAADLEAIRLALRSATRGFIIAAGT